MTVNWTAIRDAPHRYHIIVRDNFHYQNPEEEYAIMGFTTETEALAKCQKIVEQDLRDHAKPGRSVKEIFNQYQMFGEDPYIVSPEGMPPVKFSAWNYAEEEAHKFAR